MKLGIAVAAVAAISATSAMADRPVSGSEVHSQLAGKSFSLSCVNGVNGRGSYQGGVVKASYRLPTAHEDAAPVADQGSVRVRGADLCIAWYKLTGGREGCYKVSEKSPGRYRIAVADGSLWCDFAVR